MKLTYIYSHKPTKRGKVRWDALAIYAGCLLTMIALGAAIVLAGFALIEHFLL